MRRRDVIRLAGGMAVVWPLAARAQQAATPVVGFLHTGAQAPNAAFVAAFRKGLSEAGFVEGQNVAVAYRWADGDENRLSAMAAELIRLGVAVIATPMSTQAAIAAKGATTTIPVVFGVAQDPVMLGLVASFARPGGNLTGINFFTAELAAKRLELLRELVPAAVRVAVLVNPSNATTTESTLRDVEAAARAVGLQIQIFNASTSREIDAAFATLEREKPDALFVDGGAFFSSRRVQLTHLASRHAIPATYGSREDAEAGGLMSYGTSFPDTYRQMGIYTGRILKGAKPADLPVVQSTKFELVINLHIARMLGLTVPPTLLARADEVIE